MAYAIIIGGGKIGYHVSRSLINANYEVLLLEKNISIYRRLAADLGDVVMQGDGCDPLILKAAGIERAAEHLEAAGREDITEVDEFQAEATIGFIAPELIHRLGVGHARKRRRNFQAP